jgi:hypothetical protein
MLQRLIEDSKLDYKWDMDGYHESAHAIPFAIYTTPTKAYKLSISERAIWANETPVLKSSQSKETVDNFLLMLKSSLSKLETVIELPFNWNF